MIVDEEPLFAAIAPFRGVFCFSDMGVIKKSPFRHNRVERGFTTSFFSKYFGGSFIT